MGTSTIAWTKRTLNPIRAKNRHTGKVGWFCTKCSPGCDNCYAKTINQRYGTGLDFVGDSLADIELVFQEDKLLDPLRRREPSKYFWVDMSDLFHPLVPFEWVDRCWAAMLITPWHVHQVLTKRTQRLLRYLLSRAENPLPLMKAARELHERHPHTVSGWAWPAENIWVGTTVEDRNAVKVRVPALLKCPAAVRWLSCEPLLEDIVPELQAHDCLVGCECHHIRDVHRDGHRGACRCPVRWQSSMTPTDQRVFTNTFDGTTASCACHRYRPLIHWAVVGGESGGRPYHIEHGRNLVRYCREVDVPVFHKQVGSKPIGQEGVDVLTRYAPEQGTLDGNVERRVVGIDHTSWRPRVPETASWAKQVARRYELKTANWKGEDPAEWAEDLRVREWPRVPHCREVAA